MIPQSSIDSIRKLLEKVTCPLLVERDGRVACHATLLLFACGEYRFLVTAAHAIRDAVKYDANLYIPSDIEPYTSVPIPSKFFMYDDRRIDIAVSSISKDLVRHLSAHEWARLSDFVCDGVNPGVRSAMYGILSRESESWNAKGEIGIVTRTSAVFVSELCNAPPDIRDSDERVYVWTKGNSIWCTDSSGNSRTPPTSIEGLSGGPVTLLKLDPWKDDLSTEKLRIVGFQSSIVSLNNVTGEAYCKAILWPAMIGVIQSLFPSTREVLRVYGLPI